MADNKINEIMQSSLEKIKELSETGTVVGEPINTDNGTVIIPVSKVSLGFASGGVDLGAKAHKNGDDASFGGGGGTGLTIAPVGFLVVSPSGDVRFLSTAAPASAGGNNPIASVGEILEKSPDIVRKFKEIFAKNDDKNAAAFSESSEQKK